MAESVAIVPLDGSAVAESALPLALTVAKALKLRLQLVQMVPDAWPGGSERSAQALRPAEHYLSGVAASLEPNGVVVDTRALPVGDDIAAGIAGAAESAHAAMIIMATQGRTGLRRIMMGSVADAVVRTAGMPVLAVKGSSEGARTAFALSRILLALDGSELSEQVIPHVVELATATGAAVELVQVVPWATTIMGSGVEVSSMADIDQQMVEGAEQYLRKVQADLPAGIESKVHVARGDAAGNLLDLADATGSGLIVMGTRGRSGVTRWALGSVADRVLRSGKRAVLLVKV